MEFQKHGLIHGYEKLLFKYIYQNKNNNKKAPKQLTYVFYVSTYKKLRMILRHI